jgi:aspartate carbamoyltransferase catalytic subunit
MGPIGTYGLGRDYNARMSVRMAGKPSSAAKGGAGTFTWNRKDLLGIRDLTREELLTLLARTREFAGVANDPATRTGRLEGRIVATMFFEDSTRTRMSFTLAANRLSAEVIDLSALMSSVKKGESLVDTARVVEAMGVSAMVVRAKQAGASEMIARAVKCAVLNAGDGKHEHPTQGVLDLYTIAEAHGRTGGQAASGTGSAFDLSGLTVAIVGDLASSRVARSAIAGVNLLGGKVVCVGPPGLAPKSMENLGCEVTSDLDAVIPRADVVMMLRIQFERQEEKMPGGTPASQQSLIASAREYRELYGLTAERAARMKRGAIVMHPGPMNRGLEIDGEVADGPRSVVLKQVAHGVAARMAALSACIDAGTE